MAETRSVSRGDAGDLPVTLLLGLPGAGKSSLAAVLAAAGGGRAAIVVPEAGDAGIDADLLAGSGAAVARGDTGAGLAAALAGLAATRPDLASAVVETRGLADPAEAARALAAAGRPPRRIVAAVDALHGLDQMALHPAAAEQVAFADVIVLTRTDLVRPQALPAIRARLAAANPDAAVVTAATDGLAARIAAVPATDPGRLAALLAAAAARGPLDHHHADDHAHGHGHPHGDDHHHDDFEAAGGPGGFATVRLVRDDAFDPARLIDWLSGLLAARGADVARVKGILSVAGDRRPLVVQGVHMLLEADRPDPALAPAAPSRLVIVGRGLDAHALAHGLARCAAPEAAP